MKPALSSCCEKTDWSRRDLSELIEHIVQQHHAYLREELPQINQLAAQCAANPSPHKVAMLLEVQRIISALTRELTLHMHKEEVVLFPRIRQIESAESDHVSSNQPLANPIGIMLQEHRFAEEAIARLSWLTNDFTPAGRCTDEYRLLLSKLAELKADLDQHIHEENELLFPRAMELESIVLLIS